MRTTECQDPGRTLWDVAKLKPYARQGELIADVSPQELELLAEDIQRHGQQSPIEILPDGTIIDGHQRVRALKSLGIEKAWVVIRHDLPTPQQVEARFLEANFVRRQLSPLDKARVLKRLYELEDKSHGKRGQLKRRISDQLNMTTRNVSRYLRAAQAPLAVQEAFARGELSLVETGRVATLAAADQQSIAQRIQRGEPPRAAVQEYLGSKPRECPASEDPIAEVVTCATALARAIAGRPQDLAIPARSMKLLERTHKSLGELIAGLGPHAAGPG